VINAFNAAQKSDVPEYAEIHDDKNPAPAYGSMNTVLRIITMRK